MVNVSREKAYPFIQSNGHIIVTIEGMAFVLDTGSPDSFLLSEKPSLNQKEISTLCGCQVDGFIGIDLMREKQTVGIDLKNNTLQFGKEAVENGLTIPFRRGLGFLSFDVQLDGVTYNSIFDSGARINYIRRDLVPGTAARIGNDRDYNPQLGWYDVEMVSTSVEIGGTEIELPFAIMPPMLEGILSVFNVGFIIGINGLATNGITLDFGNNIISVC